MRVERPDAFDEALARGWEAVKAATPEEHDAFCVIWDDIQGESSDEARRIVREWYQRVTAEQPPRR